MNQQSVARIKEVSAQMNTILSGKQDKVTMAVICLLAKGHLLVEDVPGVGKTTLANTLAKSVDCSFGRIQFTPDTLPGDVVGVSVYNMQNGSFTYMPGAIMHNIVLADEINRTSPKTQASLLEAMAERQVTVDGTVYPLEDPFMVIATQNPSDFMGTYFLPESQLDRFLMRISMGYPKPEEEKEMAERFLSGVTLTSLKPVISKETLCQIQKEVEEVRIHEDLVKYVIDITTETRKDENLSLGAGPRATLAVLSAARACAFLNERDFVIPEDIKSILPAVLCHRLVLSMDAKLQKCTQESVLKEILRRVNVPILK